MNATVPRRSFHTLRSIGSITRFFCCVNLLWWLYRKHLALNAHKHLKDYLSSHENSTYSNTFQINFSFPSLFGGYNNDWYSSHCGPEFNCSMRCGVHSCRKEGCGRERSCESRWRRNSQRLTEKGIERYGPRSHNSSSSLSEQKETSRRVYRENSSSIISRNNVNGSYYITQQKACSVPRLQTDWTFCPHFLLRLYPAMCRPPSTWTQKKKEEDSNLENHRAGIKKDSSPDAEAKEQ